MIGLRIANRAWFLTNTYTMHMRATMFIVYQDTIQSEAFEARRSMANLSTQKGRIDVMELWGYQCMVGVPARPKSVYAILGFSLYQFIIVSVFMIIQLAL